MTRMVEVTQEDANNYCRVLTALGMEEEGDPVAEIERLRADVDRWKQAAEIALRSAEESGRMTAITVAAERERWRELIEQLIACHDEPACPAVTLAREWLAEHGVCR